MREMQVSPKDMPLQVVTADLDVQSRIREIRGVQVLIDRDLAELYGVPVKRLNEQVKRNAERFPPDFMFQLTPEECLRSQIATLNGKRGEHLKYMPYAFTESGVAMLSGVLRSEVAVAVNIRIMRAFVAMRRALLSMAPISARVSDVERRLLRQEDAQGQNEARFSQIFEAMRDKEFPAQKVFFEGTFYDAFVQMKRFVRMARRELIVVDPYFDDSCLSLLAQKRSGVRAVVVVSPRGRRNLHEVDVAQFNRQYSDSLVVKESELFHDRYLVIDQEKLVHVGASLNHLGKKCFAFSMLEEAGIPGILERIK